MTWQVEFFTKASEAHRTYAEARAMIKEMIQNDRAVGPEWNAAVARQFSAVDAWAGLYEENADLLSNGGQR